MTAALPAHVPDDADHTGAKTDEAPRLVLVPAPRPATDPLRRMQGLIALLILPAAVVLTVVAIRLPVDGGPANRPVVELVGAPPVVADRLSASGFVVRDESVVEVDGVNSSVSDPAIVYYRDSDRPLARRVRQALGRGTMVYRPMLHQGHDVTVVVGKDAEHIDDDRPSDP